MKEDKKKWNEKYCENKINTSTSAILEKYIDHVNIGEALDVACGAGRNTHYLALKGFNVDAVDISNIALKQIKKTSTINKIDADLDSYNIAPNRYDLILNINYLNRRLVSQMKDGLKSGGILIFETFLLAYGDFKHSTMNLDYLLRKNELLHTFIGLDIIYYEERVDVNIKGEKVKLASLIAKKI